MWVGLKTSRLVGVIPEARLLAFMRIAERRYERFELEAAGSGTIATAAATGGAQPESGTIATGGQWRHRRRPDHDGEDARAGSTETFPVGIAESNNIAYATRRG